VVTSSVQNQLQGIYQLFTKKISALSVFSQKSTDHMNGIGLDFTKLLPREILKHIFSYLDPASYSCAVSVNKKCRECESQDVWQQLFKITYPRSEPRIYLDWKRSFIETTLPSLYRMSKSMRECIGLINVFDTKFRIVGAIHQREPIIATQQFPTGEPVLFGKSAKGRLIIVRGFHGQKDALGTIRRAIESVDNIPLVKALN